MCVFAWLVLQRDRRSASLVSLEGQTAALRNSSADLVLGNEVQASLRYVPPFDARLHEHARCECFILVLHLCVGLRLRRANAKCRFGRGSVLPGLVIRCFLSALISSLSLD